MADSVNLYKVYKKSKPNKTDTMVVGCNKENRGKGTNSTCYC